MNDIINDILNDKKGSQYCERQAALLISQTAYLFWVNIDAFSFVVKLDTAENPQI